MKSRKIKIMVITLVLAFMASSVTALAANSFGYSFTFGSSYDTTPQYTNAVVGTGISPYINQNSSTNHAATYFMSSSKSTSGMVTNYLYLDSGTQSGKYFTCKSGYSKTGKYYLGVKLTQTGTYEPGGYTASGRWFS